MTEIINVKISSTHLGYEGHGILSSMIMLEWGEALVQGFGGWSLDNKNKTPACGIWVQGILKALELEKWEDLKGTVCRIEREPGYGGKIIAIGHYMKDKWFNPAQAFAAIGVNHV